MNNPPDRVDVAQAVRRVAEYMRQRTIQEAGGNIDNTIHAVHADPNADRALLDTRDLRILLAAPALALTDFELKDLLTQASHDPGSIVGHRRGPTWGHGHPGYAAEQETLWDWIARAAYEVVRPIAPEDISGDTY